MNPLDDILKPPAPTAERPLLGSTVLVVEDSRFACEAMRLMCLRSGARIRRADSLRAADRHLKNYHPTILIVDLGLPDGSGTELIGRVSSAVPRVDVILGLSGDPDREPEAIKAGADGFLSKPLESVAVFQSEVLRHMPAELRPSGLRAVTTEKIAPDALAFRDDMAHVADLLAEGPDDAMVDYVVQFLSGVALSAGDADLGLTIERLKSKPSQSAVATLRRAVGHRMEQASVL